MKKAFKTLYLVVISPVVLLILAGTAASLSTDLNPSYGMIPGALPKIAAVLLVIAAGVRFYWQWQDNKRRAKNAQDHLNRMRKF